MESTKVLLQLNNASFRYPTEDYLFTDVKLTLKEGDKVAIVGANGAGKSTLLKLLAGQLQPDEGEHIVNCRPYYVPQVDVVNTQKSQKVYEYISQYYENWWEVPSELAKLFDLELDPEGEVARLSGGELMKLNLAIAVKNNPTVLILDEPTNHLDISSLARLVKFITEDTKGKYSYIIVSHDTFFLDQTVNQIWELENKKITSYGGNYSFYKEQKELHLRGIKKQYDLAKDKLERTAELAQKEQERLAKRANEAKRAFISGGMDKMVYGKGKEAAGGMQKSSNAVIERLKQEAEEKLEQFQTEERRLAFISMKNTQDNRGRTILEVKDADLLAGKTQLIKAVELKIVYGDRIVVAGDNGTGKSSLIKALLGTDKNVALKGGVYRGDKMAWVYIDQNYSLIKPELNLIQNLMAYNKEITESKAKEQLGKFQFKSETDMQKLGASLSGGEMVRLILAMISSFPIDLLVMDEPTNNLDIETVEVLITALNNFRGALIVISHNMDFLSRINIDAGYKIKAKKLQKMPATPADKDRFYKALVA